MATNFFVYWSDRLRGRAFHHHSKNGGLGICQQKLPAGPGICPIFSKARGLPGRGGGRWRCSSTCGKSTSLPELVICHQPLHPPAHLVSPRPLYCKTRLLSQHLPVVYKANSKNTIKKFLNSPVNNFKHCNY